MIHFTISGVETYWWLPPLVAFVISSLTSTAGITGAFLLLPFQVSVLGFTGPGVSATNLLFNLVAIPGGVYRYIREKRIQWHLILASCYGGIPGFTVGMLIRVRYLPDPRWFKLFVSGVLFYLGARLTLSVVNRKTTQRNKSDLSEILTISGNSMNMRSISYIFQDKTYSLATWGIITVGFAVGIISGIYGIGGGALTTPILVTTFRQPVYVVAGVSLITTFIISAFGVTAYQLFGLLYGTSGSSVSPDWMLGILFGIGGIAGIYFGITLQKVFPERAIKAILAVCIAFIVVKYLVESLVG